MRIDNVRSAIIFLLTMMLPLSVIAAEPQGAVINAIRVVTVDSAVVKVEVDVSYDGGFGEIHASALAKSRNGLVRSLGVYSKQVPVGSGNRLELFAFRPYGLSATKTDVLLVKLGGSSSRPLAVKSIPYPVAWPETSIPPRHPEPSQFDLVNWALGEGDYEALESMFATWNDPRERDADGRWRLETLIDSAEEYFWKVGKARSLVQLKEWRSTIQNSSGVVLFEAKEQIKNAERIRGPIWRPSRDPVALKLYAERMQNTRSQLLSSKRFAAQVPVWYATYLDVLAGSNADDKTMQAAFDEAVETHPKYLPIYSAAIRNIVPPRGNGGDWNRVHAIVLGAVQATFESDGNSNYARLYTEIADEQPVEFDLFRDSLARWSEMKQSFEDLIIRYPSATNLNRYAAYACRVGDRATFLAMYPRIANRIVTRVWTPNHSYDLCAHRYLQQT